MSFSKYVSYAISDVVDANAQYFASTLKCEIVGCFLDDHNM